MDKPICLFCGDKHYSHEAHKIAVIFGSPPAAPEVLVVKAAPKAKVKHGSEKKTPFDRVAYQMEYMRKRRAQAQVSSADRDA
jgi:hypothetical protein